MNKTTLFSFFIIISCFINGKVKAETLSLASDSVTLNYLIGDGQSNQTVPLQHAIDSCSLAGGGTLIIPKGTYLINPIFLRSNICLYLDTLAVLLGNPDMTAYTINGGLFHLINGDSLHDVSIMGKGIIDGSGAPWWAAYKANNNLKRPRLIYVNNIINFKLNGITLKNSPSFHVKFNVCSNVFINKITITAPSNSPNTDGIDPSNSKHVFITNCTIGTGDDNIAIKSGRVYPGLPPEGICEDIHISNCRFLTGHGLSIGSETDNGVKDLTVRNCTFTGTTNGIRIKSAPGIGGPIQNVKYSNITMTNVSNPIIITFVYSGNAGTDPDTPSVKGFLIDTLTATGAKQAGSIVGLSNSILQNIFLLNVNIQAATGLVLTNANNVTLCNVLITPTTGNSIIATNVSYSSVTTDPAGGCLSQLVNYEHTKCSSTISTDSSTIFCQGDSVLLTASKGVSYIWKNGSTQVGTDSIFKAMTSGAYTVQVTDTVGCVATSPSLTVNVKLTAGNCGCKKSEQSCMDCNGVPNGSAVRDDCDRCVEGNTGKTACMSAGEAETEACGYQGVFEALNAGFEGTGYINTTNVLGAYITFSIKSQVTDSAIVSFRFANASTNARPAILNLNGVDLSNILNFPATTKIDYRTVETKILLTQGNNILKLVANTAEGLANIDQIGYVTAGISKDSCPNIVSGIKNSIEDQASVYPNPFNEQLTIQYHGIFTYNIFNMAGKEFERGIIDEQGVVGHHLKTGMYLLKIIKDDKLRYIKIIKQ